MGGGGLPSANHGGLLAASILSVLVKMRWAITSVSSWAQPVLEVAAAVFGALEMECVKDE